VEVMILLACEKGGGKRLIWGRSYDKQILGREMNIKMLRTKWSAK